jgi:NAD(P)-dependent dehydrogenase (short-subunit alcohol dehydrogenase family)
MADRTAVLTGVTGGWGRAVLDRFLAEGWNVAVTYREEHPPDDLPQPVAAVRADLSDPEAAVAVVEAAVERFGGVDALAHRGRVRGRRHDAEQPVDVWRSQMAINRHGLFRTAPRSGRCGRPAAARSSIGTSCWRRSRGRVRVHRVEGGSGRSCAA